jgi:phosphomannomutase
MSVNKTKRILALFDIDGTLTESRKQITSQMKEHMKKLANVITVGVIGGSDMVKQIEQLGDDVLTSYKYSFSENGLVAYCEGELLNSQTFIEHIGNDNYKTFINDVLKYLSEIDIPVKRGTFVEFRSGMINISPIGRSCSPDERNAFEEYDKIHNIRDKMIQYLQEKYSNLKLKYSIGGQISFDVFPIGWDKTYCLQFIDFSHYDEVHFFGDKTHEGGNDYEIFTHHKVIGHTVVSPKDTERITKSLWLN